MPVTSLDTRAGDEFSKKGAHFLKYVQYFSTLFNTFFPRTGWKSLQGGLRPNPTVFKKKLIFWKVCRGGFVVMLSDKFSLFSSSLLQGGDFAPPWLRASVRLIWAPHVRNVVSVHDLIWSLCMKGNCSSFRIKNPLLCNKLHRLY